MKMHFLIPVCLFAAIAVIPFANGTSETSLYSHYHQTAYEQVDTLISLQVTTLNLFAKYFDNGGFPHDLQATDRDHVIMYLYSVITSLEKVGLKVGYYLENGLTLAYWHSENKVVPMLAYREPGNSGFIPNGENPEMDIYLNACVNSETGQEESCLMIAGEDYISCIDDCALVPCVDAESQMSEAEVTWCQNYEIKQGNGGEGFVPLTYSCFDSTGAFSQTPGEVLVVEKDKNKSGVAQLGNCVFQSGALVERNLHGPFAYCATEASGECNTTFLGGYKSENYDHRWREWYIQPREQQQPMFSDPYIFYQYSSIGLTYTHPIYTIDQEGRKVFLGILGADIELDDISFYLSEAVKDSKYTVAIYEDEEPYYMIGISTPTSMLRNVLKGTTRTCPQEQVRSEECETVRLTVDNLVDNKGEDQIIFKAHSEMKEKGYGDSYQNVTFNEFDDIHATLYFGESTHYEKKNLKWRILVIGPVYRESDEIITKSTNYLFPLVFTACIGFVLCFTLFLLFYRKRLERAVQYTDVKLTSAFVLGCAALNLSNLLSIGETTKELCLIRTWAVLLLSSMSLSPLFVKVLRTYKMLGAPITSEERKTMI